MAMFWIPCDFTEEGWIGIFIPFAAVVELLPTHPCLNLLELWSITKSFLSSWALNLPALTRADELLPSLPSLDVSVCTLLFADL